METFSTLMLAVVLVLNLVILVKITTILRELRTPVVKKLNPDFNKQGRRVNLQDSRPQNKDNRPQQSSQRPGQPGINNGPRPQGEQNRDNREGRDNRDRNRDGRDNRDRNRDGRDGRDNRSRDGRDRNRDGRDNRDRNRRPQEIYGNDSAEAATQPVVAEPAQNFSTEISMGRPPLEGRRPLDTRNSEPPVMETPVQAAFTDAPAASESPEFDPSRMRHGRRTVVRKPLAVEDSAPAASPETPANG